jgi:hypothetical protein
MKNMAQTMNKKDSNMGNDAAARKKAYGGGMMKKKTMMKGGRVNYKHGGMAGCQQVKKLTVMQWLDVNINMVDQQDVNLHIPKICQKLKLINNG